MKLLLTALTVLMLSSSVQAGFRLEGCEVDVDNNGICDHEQIHAGGLVGDLRLTEPRCIQCRLVCSVSEVPEICEERCYAQRGCCPLEPNQQLCSDYCPRTCFNRFGLTATTAQCILRECGRDCSVGCEFVCKLDVFVPDSEYNNCFAVCDGQCNGISDLCGEGGDMDADGICNTFDSDYVPLPRDCSTCDMSCNGHENHDICENNCRVFAGPTCCADTDRNLYCDDFCEGQQCLTRFDRSRQQPEAVECMQTTCGTGCDKACELVCFGSEACKSQCNAFCFLRSLGGDECAGCNDACTFEQGVTRCLTNCNSIFGCCVDANKNRICDSNCAEGCIAANPNSKLNAALCIRDTCSETCLDACYLAYPLEDTTSINECISQCNQELSNVEGEEEGAPPATGCPNFDGDALCDNVDPDDDNDNVVDENDVCPQTKLGQVVFPTGTNKGCALFQLCACTNQTCVNNTSRSMLYAALITAAQRTAYKAASAAGNCAAYV